MRPAFSNNKISEGKTSPQFSAVEFGASGFGFFNQNGKNIVRGVSRELAAAGGRVTFACGCQGHRVSISVPEGARGKAGARSSRGQQTGSALWRV